MKRWSSCLPMALLVMGLCTTVSVAQSSPQASSASASSGHAHGVFSVELVKSLDSKKLKEGDVVEAKLTGGITLPNGSSVPSGTAIVGHVTEAKARSKDQAESTLGIVFDKIARPGGEDTPIKGVLQAVAPNPNTEPNTGGYIEYGPSMKMSTTAPGPPPMGKSPTPILNNDSAGVLGIKNLELGPQGVLTSKAKEIKLENGTRMLLNVTMQ